MSRYRSLILFTLLSLCSLKVNADLLGEGITAYQQGDYVTAFEKWNKAAFEGIADAQFNMALLYANGLGVEQDERKALGWYLRAAEQGHVEAQYNAGDMLFFGRGVFSSKQDARYWWEKAANQGYAPALHNLAVIYAYGHGVTVDHRQALVLWQKAAEKGYEQSQQALSKAYAEGLFGLPKDPVQARYWKNYAKNHPQ